LAPPGHCRPDTRACLSGDDRNLYWGHAGSRNRGHREGRLMDAVTVQSPGRRAPVAPVDAAHLDGWRLPHATQVASRIPGDG